MACVWGCILTLIAFVGSFSTVRFQICPQISCPREGKITVAAFVWLFSTVGFQMSPQMACLSRMQSCIGCMCITFLHCAFSNVSPNCFTLFTFVAFVWFFSTVRCQMCPQNVSTRRGKVTLVAFVGLFSTVRFQMCPQSTCIRGCILTLAAIIWLVSTVHFHICLQMSNVSLMNVQVSFLCKTFSTLIAQEGTHRMLMTFNNWSKCQIKLSLFRPKLFWVQNAIKLIGGVNAIQKMI